MIDKVCNDVSKWEKKKSLLPLAFGKQPFPSHLVAKIMNGKATIPFMRIDEINMDITQH